MVSKNMQLLKGENAARIKRMASDLDAVLSEAFIDVALRAAVWVEPSDSNLILLKIMASDIDGRFVNYGGHYSVEDDEFFFDKKLSKAFRGRNGRDMAEKAILEFIRNMIQIPYPINRIMFDLSVIRYLFVKIGPSLKEKGSVDIHICAYDDMAKDDYAFADAKRVVGNDLASF